MGPLENLAAAGDLLASLTNILASLKIFGDTFIVPVRKQSLVYNLNHIDTATQTFWY